MSKKIISIVCMCICMFVFSVTSFASIQYVIDNKEYEYTGKDVTIELDGERLICDIPPIIHDERTLLPIRALIEKLGGEVAWDGVLQMVTVSLDKTEVSMIIGNKNAMVNGEKKALDVAPCLAYENGDSNTSRTIIPLRFVMENLGLEVEWIAEEFKAIVNKKEVVENNKDKDKEEDNKKDNDKDDEKEENQGTLDTELGVIDEEYMVKVGVYYDDNAKSKLTITAKTDIMIGTIKKDEFIEKETVKKNTKITVEPSGKYVKITVNGKVLDEIKASEVKFVPKENSSKSKIITVNGLDYRGCAIVTNISKKLIFVNELTMQEYLCSVVPSEMPASYGLEAVKAQAVAARTYALSQITRHTDDGFNLCSTTHCQVYSGMRTENSLTTQAVEETKDMIVTYKGELISTYYSASMGGYTEDVENVWGKAIPYLKAVKDPYEPKMTPGTIYFSKKEIENKLKNKNINIGDVVKIEVTKWTDAGRAYELVITGTKGKTTFVREGTRTFFNLKGQMYTIDGGDGLVGLANAIKKNAETIKTEIKYIKINTEALNVREKPSAESEKIGVVYKNDKFDILDEEDGFIKIEFENEDEEITQGWVSEDYVKVIEDEEKSVVAKVAKITASEMNIRKKASTSSSIIGTASENEGYVIIGEKGNWVNVVVGKEEGWLSKDYIKIVEYDLDKLDKVSNIQKQLVKDGFTFRILITVYDNGHGVGMSQNGAKGMAQEGFNYKEILQFYYTGVEIEEMK